jgi:predicted ATPase
VSKLGKLNRIQLEGFKSIKQMDLTLGDLNVLIGPNGAGKSNFINFFRFMNALQQKELQLYVAQRGTAEAFLHFGSRQTTHIKTHLYFNPNGYEAILVPTQEGRLVFESEKAEFFADKMGYSGGTKRYVLANTGDEESKLPKNNMAHPPNYVSRYISNWKIYHFHDTSDDARVKKSCNIHDNLMLKAQADNLAAFLYSIRETPEYQHIVQTIRRIAPFFHDFILRPNKTHQELIRLRWKHRGSEDYFDANSLSDGTLRFMCLTTLLLQPELPTTILLDEPELGLHPYALQILAGMLKSTASKTQIIASTQSVTLANQLTPEDIIVVDQQDGASQFKRLVPEELAMWLEEYRIGDLWEKNLIGGTP